MSDVPLYYWDACIFLERLKKEEATPARRQGVQNLLALNRARECAIFTSAISHLECLPKKLTTTDQEAEVLYRAMFGSRYFYDVPIDGQVLSLAREIRDFYFQEADPKRSVPYRMMGLGDAVHLATAIIEGVTTFHTRDGNRKGGNVPLLGIGKLSPGGKVAGKYDLEIASPEEEQLDMEFLAEESANEKAN